MKKNFGFRNLSNKLKISAQCLRMDFERGEGELEIMNQGWSKISSFSQETVAIGQQEPWNGDSRPKLGFTQRVPSAGCTGSSDSTPLFFFSMTETLQQEMQLFMQLQAEKKFLLAAHSSDSTANPLATNDENAFLPKISFALPSLGTESAEQNSQTVYSFSLENVSPNLNKSGGHGN